ncbi:unnamed protein product [Polarella glacialis]|uniref:MCM C-terminal AAA(+) ATPase domain-containing protein n=1 Tax=Polarella glacialis TaxID=89957 RepID=A0A813GMC0_POLGL|nr:unnamed protein product [Polarella glacialis]
MSAISLDRLAGSVAPSVCGQQRAKKGLLLMMLGGVAKGSKSSVVARGTIHVCLHGEPETAKSRLLQWAALVLPHSVYVSGATSSAAGLTAAIIKDDSGQNSVAGGALVQASGGICCIDNFEAMAKRDQAAIREVMDQQSITLSKAGLHAKLGAPTSVLVAYTVSEVKEGQASFGRKRNFSQQEAGLSGHLLSGFDLVLAMPQSGEEVPDEDIARHILGMASGSKQAPPDLSLSDFQRYIRIARAIEPTLSPEAQQRLTNCYTELRRDFGCGANPRHLESLIRLSEAVARGCFSEEVQVPHVSEAFELLHCSLQAAACVQRLEGQGTPGTAAGSQGRYNNNNNNNSQGRSAANPKRQRCGGA